MASARDEEDTRKVQTAVFGGPDGRRPAFLPYEKQPADRLRQVHGANAFTCGVLLGGCGKLLTLRACDDKKSHFAHRPPVRCSRTSVGESSADHLYIGEALLTWLSTQGRPNAAVAYVKQSHARSDAIEIRFGSQKKRRLLHVQMSRRSFKDWSADGERIAAGPGRPPSIRMYGPDSQLSPFEVDARGYALRFRCETKQGTREVFVGTQSPDHRVEWTTLDRCRLTDRGILTPWLEHTADGIRFRTATQASGTSGPSRSAVTPEPKAAAGVPALALAPGLVAFTGARLSSEVSSDRHVYDADAQPHGSAGFRARISLPAATDPPEPHRVYVLAAGAAVVGPTPAMGSGTSWSLRAERIVRLTPAKAVEWDVLRPPPAPDVKVVTDPIPVRVPVEPSAGGPTPPPPAPAAEPAPSTEPEPAPARAPEPKPATMVERPAGDVSARPADDVLVKNMARVLMDIASAGTTITWRDLLRAVGVRPEDVSVERQLGLLTAVDGPRARSSKPLLCCLVTFSAAAQPVGTPPAFFRRVLLALGWPHWTSEALVAMIWTKHQQRLHRAARHDAPDGPPGRRAPSVADPVGDLVAILRKLDEAPEDVSSVELYRFLEKADRLVVRTGEPFIPGPVMQRLQHWHMVLRDLRALRTDDADPAPAEGRTEQKPDEPGAEHPESEGQAKAGHDEARRVFYGLVGKFRAARDAGDLREAKAARGAMGSVYAVRLSPEDREAATPLVREFKQWVRDQEPSRPPVDPPLQRIREIIVDLASGKDALTSAELSAALDETARLRRRLAAPLPEAEQKRLGRWRGNLRHRLLLESNAGEPVRDVPADPSDHRRDTPRHTPRLSRERIEGLADLVRVLLHDAARAGTTLTWGDMRRRTEGALPYLHPDDQGEILVAVDLATPADEPLLSALVPGADLSPHGLYRHVRHSLGRERVPDEALETHWRMDVLRLYSLWRHR
ncbi:competence protein CoiA family protein [Streptomyces sp. NPDC060030]|uniref:competence protein CoiA family protein n=1 Tax=Streptomyces sp. NPDC060030 TaxID=3347042 RepID=UPI0036821232